MKKLKAIAAGFICAAVMVGSAGCADISTMGTVDGEEIKAGVYLYYEQTAMGEAQDEINSQLEEMGTSSSDIEGFSYFDYNVQDKTYSQYVQDRTLQFVKQHVAVQNKFEELGLSLTDEEKAEIKSSTKEFWNTEITYYGYSMDMTYGESYEQMGISRSSYEAVQTVEKMSNKLFDAYYDTNGVTATDEKDIETYFHDNFGRFQIIQVSLTEGDGSAIETDEGKAAKKEQAQGYLDRILAGEDFDEVYHDYEEQVAYEQEQAEKEENSGEETSEEEEEEHDHDDETSDDTTSSGSEEVEEEEHDHEFLLSKEDTSPSEEFIEWAFALKNDEGKIYEDETVYYVVVRRDISERTDWYDENRLDILHLMKDEEFDELLTEAAKDYELDFNDAALNAYKPENLRTA